MQYPWKKSSGSFSGRMLGSSHRGIPQLPHGAAVCRALHMRPSQHQCKAAMSICSKLSGQALT